MQLPKIIDNQRRKFIDIFNNIADGYNQISIATGYWDLLGTKLVINKLKHYKKIRLLIGREPLLKRDNKKNVEQPEPDYPDEDFFYDLERIQPSIELKEVVQQIKALIEQGVLEVKVYRRSFLHAKCYIFGNYESSEAVGIIGSSNFTRNGITSNIELNALESDHRVVMFQPKSADQEVGHLYWFDELWDDEKTEDWTGEFTEILGESIVGDVLFSPYEMYIHSLYNIYKDELVSSIKVSEDSENVLYAFQVRNAELLLKKLDRHGVAMLADSVGLGKTITAGAVIKRYIEDKNKKKPRIELVVPASLKSQWQSELLEHHGVAVGLDGVYISSLQNKEDINSRKEIDKYRPVDLFVIDEAHNLRNANSQRYEEIIEWIQANEGCHVLLVTATPINNQLSDFATQINLASGGREDLFYVQLPKMDGRQQTIKEHYDAIIDLDREIKREVKEGKKVDTEKIKKVMRPILQHFMVRSTRVGIEREFGGVVTKDGLLMKFPKAHSFEERYFTTDKNIVFNSISSKEIPLQEMLTKDVESIIENRQLTRHPLDLIAEYEDAPKSDVSPIHKVFLLSTYLGLPIYRPTLYQRSYYGKSIEQINEYLKNNKIKKEEKFDVKQQMTMHNMMRILYLKRVESSVYSLKKSMEYYSARLLSFKKILNEQGKIVRVSKLQEFTEYLLEDTFGQEAELAMETIAVEADEKIYNIDQLKKDIEKDEQILKVIISILGKLVEDDDKIKHFSGLLNDFASKGKKVLIFSYFTDTIEFLDQYLPKSCPFLTADNSGFTIDKNKKNIQLLAKCFSPISKRYTLKPEEKELQYLFSTDVLSEGQNLQDCAVLVNYDLHWNPVRMIQRNGRINRLGSKHEEVFIHNLCPADEIEAYLKLEDRLKRKIELIKSSVGTDQQILNEQINAIEFNEEAILGGEKSRDLTLQIYSNNVEDVTKSYEEETDILGTEDVFIADLRRFDDNATEEQKMRIYHRIPLGKWGVLPVKSNDKVPDVIVHTTISIKEGQEIQPMPIFVGFPRGGQTITFLDRLDALNALQAAPDYKSESLDVSLYNNEKIRTMLDEYLIQIAEQSIVRIENDLKPHQTVVLDQLHLMKMPYRLVERVLKECRNRTNRNQIAVFVRRLHDNLKSAEPMNQKTLSELLSKSQKIVEKMDQRLENKPTIESDPIIYSYHAKP